MPARSSATHYGSVAVAIHWTSAAAVILTFALGYVAANVVAPPPPVGLMAAHIVFGLLVFALTLLRIVWWLFADRHPAAPANQPAWQVRTAQLVHSLLYVVLVLMATSGIVTLILTGAVPAIFAGGPVPDFSGIVPRIAHGIMSRILLVLFVVHVGAALYHQVVRRDRLLARMGVGV